MQVGLGMTIASIDTIHSPSSAESTGNMTDMAIEGGGYFILGDGLDRFYTRAGNFGFDNVGNFINTANGLKVQGWQDTTNHEVPNDKSPQSIRDIQIREGMMIPASHTTEITFAKNLNAGTISDESYSLPFKVYDSQGHAHSLTIEFTKTATINEWNYEINSPDGSIDSINNNTGTITFDSNGENPTVSGVTGNFTGQPNNGASQISFNAAFTGITQYAKETNIDLISQNGYPAGTYRYNY